MGREQLTSLFLFLFLFVLLVFLDAHDVPEFGASKVPLLLLAANRLLLFALQPDLFSPIAQGVA